MARNKLDGVAPSLAGSTTAFTAATVDGDAVRPNTALLVRNGSAGVVTLTLVTAGMAENYAIADPTVAIPAGQDRFIGPFSRIFPQPAGADEGWVYIDYSAFTSVTRVALAPW